VSPEDLDIFRVCDDPAEGIAHVGEVLARRSPGLDPHSLAHVQAHKSDAQ
jgi:hypothetical protein